MVRVAGIVLAAGESARMGEPKPLLDAGGRTFIECAVGLLAGGGCAPVIAVVRPEPANAEPQGRIAALARAAGALVVANPEHESGQIDSLRCALVVLPADSAACAVLPVDHPLVAPGTVAALIAAFTESGAPIIVPSYGGRRGHPTLFARSLFHELRHGDLAEGARTVLRAHANAVLELPVGDPGILADVDSPADYRRYFAEP